MNIAFLFAWHETDIWTNTKGLYDEFIQQGHNCRLYSLFDENKKNTDVNIQEMLNDANSGRFVPDIIFHLDFGPFQSNLLNKQLFPEAFWIMEAGDDPQSYPYNSRKVNGFDLILSPDYQCVQLYKNAKHNALWWTHFADTEMCLWSLNPPPIYSSVTTKGLGGEGSFFRQLKNILKDNLIIERGLVGIEHFNFLKKGKIVIQNSSYKEISRRIFEGMLCRRLVITDRLSNATHIDELFTEGEDIIYYNSVEECAELVKYYNEHDTERERIAENGFLKVKQNHTQVQRVQQIFDYILKRGIQHEINNRRARI